uniref:Uncharacterized protein n=1 Tax=Nelumbo nucifera TaxID=4432 RepID=A0A822Z354_NELNU|nr:TPA_asm: hypothetical protein HUJ06_008526 [Nelumbo nucifera]
MGKRNYTLLSHCKGGALSISVFKNPRRGMGSPKHLIMQSNHHNGAKKNYYKTIIPYYL